MAPGKHHVKYYLYMSPGLELMSPLCKIEQRRRDRLLIERHDVFEINEE
jgi:hypothetical protein